MEGIQEWRDVDRQTFENDIVPAGQPAVLRSLLEDWPAVREARDSVAAVATYLKGLDRGRPVTAIVGPPSIGGRFFYNDPLTGFNFESRNMTVTQALDALLATMESAAPPAMALQAIPAGDVLPEFAEHHALPLLDTGVTPRLWLGNQTQVAAHFDNNFNIACVVAGRRRITVFPPDQVANLYIGPLLNTPGGSPVSMVNLHQPDFELFPRFEEALKHARQATLEPGDALYIPILWWHAVDSLERFNMLVNYWWNQAPSPNDKPFHGLVHSMLLISRLPPEQRAQWRQLFDHFVFQTNGDPAAHLPADIKDVLGNLTPAEREQLKHWLAKQLTIQ